MYSIYVSLGAIYNFLIRPTDIYEMQVDISKNKQIIKYLLIV